jgi:hypothetical protein
MNHIISDYGAKLQLAYYTPLVRFGSFFRAVLLVPRYIGNYALLHYYYYLCTFNIALFSSALPTTKKTQFVPSRPFVAYMIG